MEIINVSAPCGTLYATQIRKMDRLIQGTNFLKSVCQYYADIRKNKPEKLSSFKSIQDKQQKKNATPN